MNERFTYFYMLHNVFFCFSLFAWFISYLLLKLHVLLIFTFCSIIYKLCSYGMLFMSKSYASISMPSLPCNGSEISAVKKNKIL